MSEACWAGQLEDLESTILDLLRERPADATIPLDDAVRRVIAGDDTVSSADGLTELARAAARRLAEEGQVDLVQDGRILDPVTAHGPISVRLARPEQ